MRLGYQKARNIIRCLDLDHKNYSIIRGQIQLTLNCDRPLYSGE